MTRKVLALGLLAGAVGAGWFYTQDSDTLAPEVRTASVTRGPIVTTVSATGTTEAVTSVTVGSQVSGTVVWLGADFNSVVRKGQVIARLDPSLLAAQVEQARANLTKGTADRQQRAMNLADKETKLARVLKLNEQKLVSATEVGDATLAVEVAKTDLLSAEAQVAQVTASLRQAEVNLGHATITAPIDGTVIGRSVDVGQTVAASLSSPTLFLIAADLAKMRVSLSVDESDISRIEAGQTVSISVSAYPGETFRGEVAQVRLQPIVASNVTSYATIVDVTNTDLKLKPGMTANASIEVARRDDVLRVPNAALRFTPTDAQFAAIGQAAPESNTTATVSTASATDDITTLNGTRVVLARSASVRPSAGVARSEGSTATGKPGRVWLIDEGTLRSVPVRVGLADTSHTEIFTAEQDADEGLVDGAVVVTSISTGQEAATTPAAVSSIFSGSGPGAGRGGPR